MSELARRIAATAPGVPVKVSVAGRELADSTTAILSAVPVVSASKADVDAALTAAVAEQARTATALQEHLEATRRASVESIQRIGDQIAAVLRQPVRPVYDASGKLVEARRVAVDE